MALAVIIAVRGAREGAIAAAIGADKRLNVARRCADLPEALAAASAGAGEVAVLSEHPRLDRAVVADLVTAGVTVVGVPHGADSADHLRSLGITDLIGPEADAKAVAQVIVDARRRADSQPATLPPPPAMRPRRGRVIAVWGPTGAPGRTTVAVSVAVELAAHMPVIVVDADTYGGAVGQALGLLDESPGLAVVARASLHGTLDDSAVVQHAIAVAPRLHVLTGITRADRWPELSAAALDPVWPALGRHADAVVVDCGFSLERDEVLQYDTRAPQRNGATLSALAAADVVVAVGAAEPVSMQRLVHGLAALDQVVPREKVPRVVVVNRVRASVAGQYPREAVADALRRYASVEQVWTVPFDGRAADAAALTGRTLAECAPRSPARRAFTALAPAVMEAQVEVLPSASHVQAAPERATLAV